MTDRPIFTAPIEANETAYIAGHTAGDWKIRVDCNPEQAKHSDDKYGEVEFELIFDSPRVWDVEVAYEGRVWASRANPHRLQFGDVTGLRMRIEGGNTELPVLAAAFRRLADS